MTPEPSAWRTAVIWCQALSATDCVDGTLNPYWLAPYVNQLIFPPVTDRRYSPLKLFASRCWMMTPSPEVLIQAETLKAPVPTTSSAAGSVTYELVPLN